MPSEEMSCLALPHTSGRNVVYILLEEKSTTPTAEKTHRVSHCKVKHVNGNIHRPKADLQWVFHMISFVSINLERFPFDFMFQLKNQEVAILRSQFATSSSDARSLAWGGRRYTPHAFTEHGALMAAMVLNSLRATEVSVYVVRAFVELRDTLVAHKELAKRLDELESRLERKLATHDQAITGILDAIRQLMAPPEPTKKRRIGFVQND